MPERLPFTMARTGLRLAVRLTPRASADRVLGVIEDGHGGWAIKATVTAPPLEGAANAALVQLLARHFGIKPRDFDIVLGTSGRLKLVEIEGDPAPLRQRVIEGLSPWLKQS